MTSTPPTVIAEAGVNHNGDLARAREMVAAVAATGADIVKFQAFQADRLVTKTAATAAYQHSNTGLRNQVDMLQALELTLYDFAVLADDCRNNKIEFLCTPFDIDSLNGLMAIGMARVKVASGELTNLPLLRAIGGYGVPVILSTGMANVDEVAVALAALRDNGAGPVTLLHCTSQYPAPIDSLNLRAIVSLRDRFGVSVGYSDHSVGNMAAIAAVALGATVIEKHFTLDRSLPGPDHAASLLPNEVADLVAAVRDAARALGNGRKQPTAAELETARLVRQSWHAARNLARGHVIGDGDAVLKRPDTGLAPAMSPVGRSLRVDVMADMPLRADDLVEDVRP